MILYNVTIKIEWEIHADWIQWMKEEHMPGMLATGCFTHYQLLRIIDTDDSDGPTYACQYFADSKALYNKYIEEFSTVQRKRGTDKWGNRFVAFRTVMQVVD
jgi:hypothetical protein